MENTRTTKGAGQRETGQSSRLTQNNSNTPGGRPGGSAPQGTPPTGRVSWLRWLIFIVVINLIFYAPLLFSALGAQQIRLMTTMKMSNRSQDTRPVGGVPCGAD